jgi:hypothetical protein
MACPGLARSHPEGRSESAFLHALDLRVNRISSIIEARAETRLGETRALYMPPLLPISIEQNLTKKWVYD